jgi:hypothetical protein
LSIEIRKKNKKIKNKNSSAYCADHDPISGTSHAPGFLEFGGKGHLPLILARDTDVAIQAEKEPNLDAKVWLLYYLANYYDIRRNKILADTYFGWCSRKYAFSMKDQDYTISECVDLIITGKGAIVKYTFLLV